jgi:hypothetical protein
MVYKIFFAFQMDTDDKFNKGFIQSAIEIAIEKFKKEGVTIKLDFGFRGTPGTPLLIEEMLKKSYESDMVIVDLTFTSSKNWFNAKKWSAFGREFRILDIPNEKKSSNPNVLLETGYAWAQKGYHRTLAVMNEAFGKPDELSVDLKGFRYGITFNLDKVNYSDRKTEREKLASALYKAIRDSITSEASYQREKWKPLKIYQDWKSEDFEKPYLSVSGVKDIVNKLRGSLRVAGQPQRIVGPKNSGKTRLARELFNYIDDELPKDESIEKTLYYDFYLTSYQSIENKIIDLALVNQDKVIILDNCPLELHQKICKQLYDTNVRILSICEEGPDKTIDGATIRIDPELARKIVDTSVREKFSGTTAASVIQFADGNIREAMTYINSDITDDVVLEVGYTAKWRQLLGKHFDSGGLQLLEALSIFTHVGFTANHAKQSEFIMTDLCRGMEDFIFLTLLERFKELGIIKAQGDFVLIEGFVEELAVNWWTNQKQEDLGDFFKRVENVGLSKALGNRLIELSQKSESGDIIKIVTANTSIFDYDFLNTDQGARLMISLSEIAPIEIMEGLNKCFESKSREELLLFRNGRRNIVWALERLCFRKETFRDSTKLLYRLAQAENENIVNNATNKFYQLFQPFLAGTEVDLKTRLDVLKELVKN